MLRIVRDAGPSLTAEQAALWASNIATCEKLVRELLGYVPDVDVVLCRGGSPDFGRFQDGHIEIQVDVVGDVGMRGVWTLAHELGHALRGVRSKVTLNDRERCIASTVSDAATDDREEFVAESFASLAFGMALSPEAESLLVRLTGWTIEPAASPGRPGAREARLSEPAPTVCQLGLPGGSCAPAIPG